MTTWRWLVSLLVSLSSSPDAIHEEAPKAAAAVAVAYAQLPQRELPPDPKPAESAVKGEVKSCPCGGACSPACTCGCRKSQQSPGSCSSGSCKK